MPTRRTVLRGGLVLATSAVVAGGPAPALGAPSPLALRYRSAQATGWPASPGARTFSETIGGHRVFQEFTFDGKPYRICLRGPDPRWLRAPADSEIAFGATLAEAFGSHYTFRYRGFRGREQLVVESYSVFVEPPANPGAPLAFGADLYLTYRHGPGGPPTDDRLRWIQVVQRDVEGMPTHREVDNLWRANPYYFYGGATSVDGRDVVNFYDVPQSMVQGAVSPVQRFTAEVFLVRDAGRVVDVLGGVGWGWQVRLRHG
jgi:hypothetical protein